jgi:transposase InsO family protein
MDWQQLPAIKGNKGFEYKISVIHLSSRVKYSEIHNNYNSSTLASFLVRAMDRLPPFYIVFTDNAMSFTMKFSHHPERRTAFTKQALEKQIIHALVAKGKPWYNGFIERSNRTDNEALFNRTKFTCSEDRRYQHRLWEMYYNRRRPHQSLAMATPLEIASVQHPIRYTETMLS